MNQSSETHEHWMTRLGVCCLHVYIYTYMYIHVYRYVKRLIKYFQHKEEGEEDIYARWEKDYDLVPNSVHGLFYEYLELGMCTCTTTIMCMYDYCPFAFTLPVLNLR